MRKLVTGLLLLFSIAGYAQLGTVDLNAGHDPTSYVNSLGNTCPRPINCTPGTNFLRLSDANRCGCCACDGGSVGCAGGTNGQVVCADGTYAKDCNCRYNINTD
ncbi:MAG: hypothetical protein ACK4PR_01325 [Gammaproteobacteria bacterium]